MKLADLGLSKQYLRWLWSFLTNRTAITKIGSSYSTESKITSGVIQGGHCSPLCFISFIDDLLTKLLGVEVSAFADDAKIHKIIGDMNDVATLQKAIDDFVQICDEKGLKINTQKCVIMSITNKNKNYIENAYTMNGNPIRRVHSHKDLGVVLKNNLDVNEHNDHSVSKARSMLGLIKRTSAGCFSTQTMKTLYTSLVRSHLDYANILCDPNSNSQSNNIESV